MDRIEASCFGRILPGRVDGLVGRRMFANWRRFGWWMVAGGILVGLFIVLDRYRVGRDRIVGSLRFELSGWHLLNTLQFLSYQMLLARNSGFECTLDSASYPNSDVVSYPQLSVIPKPHGLYFHHTKSSNDSELHDGTGWQLGGV